MGYVMAVMSFARCGCMLLFVAACSAAERDPVDVLAFFGEIVKDNASRIRNTTCVQTIERQYYQAKLTKQPRTCDDLAAERRRPGYKRTLESTDRLRLDVRAGPTAEMYSWPGAERFDDRTLWDIIGYGPAATGPFGMALLQVVQGDATDFTFIGETDAGGRKLFRYGFRVPAERSHYAIQDVPAAWMGTLDLDPETSQPVRMVTRVSELPPEAFVCDLQTDARYARTAIGGRELLLSRETRQRFIERSGAEVENVVTFSACREYKAESRVSFGSASGEAPAGPPKAIRAARLDLPPDLPVTIELTTRIDSATAAGGDRFAGRLAKPVVDEQDRALVPEGAVVAGRLVKVAVRMEPPEVAIVLHVETVQFDGAEYPFHLTGRTPVSRRDQWLRLLSNVAIAVGAGAIGVGFGGITIVNHPPAPEGELNVLRFSGTRQVIEPGFKTEWMTVRP